MRDFGFQVFGQLKVWCLRVSKYDGPQESFSKDLIVRTCMLQLRKVRLFDVRKLGWEVIQQKPLATRRGCHSLSREAGVNADATLTLSWDVEDAYIWDELSSWFVGSDVIAQVREIMKASRYACGLRNVMLPECEIFAGSNA